MSDMAKTNLRCKLYADTIGTIKNMIAKGTNISDNIFVNQLVLIKQDLCSKNIDVQNSAREMLDFLINLQMEGHTVTVEYVKIVNEDSTPLYLKDSVEAVVKNLIRKTLDSNDFKKIAAPWAQYNNTKLLDIIEHWWLDLDDENRVLFYFERVIPQMYSSTNMDPVTRSLLIDVAYKLFPYISVSVLSRNSLQQLLNNITSKYIQTVGELRETKFNRWHELWIFLIKLCGKHIHNSVELTNRLLRVVECAFRNSSYEERIVGYNCWKELIDNASLDMDRMCSTKQIKLLITPLKAKFSKQDVVIVKRFEVFVYLLEKLQSKATLILAEFLEFCFGPVGDNVDTTKIGQGKSVSTIWLRSIKVLMELLGHSDNCIESNTEIRLDKPLINSTNFANFYKIIVNSVGEACVLFKDGVFDDDHSRIVRCLWGPLNELIFKLPKDSRIRCFEYMTTIINSYIKDCRRNPYFMQTLAEVFKVMMLYEKESLNELFQYMLKPILDVVINITEDLHADKSFDVFLEVLELTIVSDNRVAIVEQIVSKFVVNKSTTNVCHMNYVWLVVNNELPMEVVGGKHFWQFFMWPIGHLHKLDKTTVNDVLRGWKLSYCKSTNDTVTKFNVLRELEHTFKNNPLLRNNVIFALETVLECEAKPEKVFVIKALDLVELITMLPSLDKAVLGNLSKITERFLDSSMELNTYEDNENSIEKICSCIDHLLRVHKFFDLLKPLLKFLENISTKSKVKFAKFLSKLMLDLTNENSGIESTSAKTIQKISQILDDASKESLRKKSPFVLPPGRSATISQMIIKQTTSPSSKRIKMEPFPSAMMLFGKGPSDNCLRVKGSQMHNISPRSKKIAHITPQKKIVSSINDDKSSDFVPIDTEIKFQPDKLSEHQKEVLKRRREDIPALYQDLSQSQSQDIFNSKSSESSSKTHETDSVIEVKSVVSNCAEVPEVDGTDKNEVPLQDTVVVLDTNDEPIKEVVEPDTNDEPIKEVVGTDTNNETTMEIIELDTDDEPTKEVVEPDANDEPTKEIVEPDANDEPTKEVVESDTNDEPTMKVVESDNNDEPKKDVVDPDTTDEPSKTVDVEMDDKRDETVKEETILIEDDSLPKAESISAEIKSNKVDLPVDCCNLEQSSKPEVVDVISEIPKDTKNDETLEESQVKKLKLRRSSRAITPIKVAVELRKIKSDLVGAEQISSVRSRRSQTLKWKNYVSCSPDSDSSEPSFSQRPETPRSLLNADKKEPTKSLGRPRKSIVVVNEGKNNLENVSSGSSEPKSTNSTKESSQRPETPRNVIWSGRTRKSIGKDTVEDFSHGSFEPKSQEKVNVSISPRTLRKRMNITHVTAETVPVEDAAGVKDDGMNFKKLSVEIENVFGHVSEKQPLPKETEPSTSKRGRKGRPKKNSVTNGINPPTNTTNTIKPEPKKRGRKPKNKLLEAPDTRKSKRVSEGNDSQDIIESSQESLIELVVSPRPRRSSTGTRDVQINKSEEANEPLSMNIRSSSRAKKLTKSNRRWSSYYSSDSDWAPINEIQNAEMKEIANIETDTVETNIIEETQNVNVPKQPQPDKPKETEKMDVSSTQIEMNVEVNDSLKEVTQETKVTPSDSQADTETCESNGESLTPVIKYDVPVKPNLTDSEKCMSRWDTITLDSEDLIIENKTIVQQTEAVNVDWTPVKEQHVEDKSQDLVKDEEVVTTPLSNVSLPTSPITGDTPNRTSELLNNTLDISPINSQSGSTKDTFAADSEEVFKTSETNSVNVDEAIKELSAPSERSTKLLSMINIDSPVTHRLMGKRRSMGVSMSPSTARIKKLMSTFNPKKDKDDVVSDVVPDDILTFTRDVPSPMALPKSGILKRKLPDVDDGLSPCAKRKRVNFSDPITTSKKIFIRDEHGQCEKHGLEGKVLFEKTPLSDSDDIAEDLTETEPAATENSLEITNALLLHSNKPIYPELVDCQDAINSTFIKKLSSPMFFVKLLSQLNSKDIHTIGDLAKQSEMDVNRFPFKGPIVKNVFNALDNYYKTAGFEKSDIKTEITEGPSSSEEDKSPVANEDVSGVVAKGKSEVVIGDLARAVMESIDKDSMLMFAKDFYKLSVQDLLGSYKPESLVQHLIESEGVPGMLNVITKVVKSNGDESIYFDCLVKQALSMKSLTCVLEKQPPAQVKQSLHEMIESNTLNRQEFLMDSLNLLVKSPNDIRCYFDTLNHVQLMDVVIERLHMFELGDFVAKLSQACSKQTTTDSSSMNIVNSFKVCVDSLPTDTRKQTLVDIFRFVGSQLSMDVLLDLHCEFLKSIPRSIADSGNGNIK